MTQNHIASQTNLSKEERARLDEDWKNYNDFFNTMDYAKAEGRYEGRIEGRIEGREEGLAEGREEGLAKGRAEGRSEGIEEGRTEGKAEGLLVAKQETAQKQKALGIDLAIISQATGHSIQEIEAL